jgi:hypothetical protein
VVAVRRLSAVRHDRVVAPAAACGERFLGGGAQQLGGEPLAVHHPPCVTRLRPREERRDRGLAGDRRLRGAPDAVELVRRLSPPALVEEPLIGDELDAVGAQRVGDPDREGERHARPRDPERSDGAHRLRGLDLVVVDPRRDEVVDGDRLGRDDLDRRVDRCNPVAFDAPDDRDPPLADLGVEKRVADAERQLVPQLHAPLSVPDDQEVGHATSLTTGRGTPRG